MSGPDDEGRKLGCLFLTCHVKLRHSLRQLGTRSDRRLLRAKLLQLLCDQGVCLAGTLFDVIGQVATRRQVGQTHDANGWPRRQRHELADDIVGVLAARFVVVWQDHHVAAGERRPIGLPGSGRAAGNRGGWSLSSPRLRQPSRPRRQTRSRSLRPTTRPTPSERWAAARASRRSPNRPRPARADESLYGRWPPSVRRAPRACPCGRSTPNS